MTGTWKTTPLQDELIEHIRVHGPKNSHELAAALAISVRAVTGSLSSTRGAGIITDGIVCWQRIALDGSHNNMIHSRRPDGPIIWHLEELDLREMYDTAYAKQLIDEANQKALLSAASAQHR